MIRFIICGWHMNQPSLINGLHDLMKLNSDDVHVFWACHREPTEEIREKFDHKVFFNGGEEYGAYEQAVNYLDIDDDDICFFLHDDLVLKSFDFIPLVVEGLQDLNVIGNGANYPEPSYDINEVIEVGIKEEFDGVTRKDYVKEENQHLFDKIILDMNTIRPSFLAMRYSDVKKMGGFEPRHDAYEYPRKNKEGVYVYRGNKGMSTWGNEFPQLNNYKFNKVFGGDKIGYLSKTYLDSPFVYECARGKVVSDHPITEMDGQGIKVKDVKTGKFYEL